MMRFLFPLLLLLLSVQANPERLLGSYELVLEK